MTIFELLAVQHDEVEDAFRAVHNALERRDADGARMKFRTLSTKLLACMRAEHAIVYPSLAYHAGLDDEVRRAIREHDKIEQAINHLRLVPLAPDAWQGALTRLQLLVTDHVETEAWILFPVGRLRMTTVQSTKLAVDFQAHYLLALATSSCSITYTYEPSVGVTA